MQLRHLQMIRSTASQVWHFRHAWRGLTAQLLLLCSAAVGCVAPGTSTAPLPSGEISMNSPAGPSEPSVDHSPASHVVPAAHVVPVREVALNRPQVSQGVAGSQDGMPSREGLDTSNGRTEAVPIPAPTIVSAAPADQPVDYFIMLALEAHPRIAAARQRLAAAAQEIPQARALADPMLGNTFWPIPDQALQTAAGRVAHQMSLSQEVPWPEKLDARAAIAQREVEMARAEVDRVEREITEAVRLAYYELWYAARAIEIIRDNRALVEDLIAVAEARYRTGGSQQDVLRAELEAEKLDDQLITLGRDLEVAQADLAALVQQPLDLAPRPVRELDLPTTPGQLDALVAAALRCNPELRMLEWEIARDRERQRLAGLQRYPDFQFGVGWSLVTEEDAVSRAANGHDNINFTLGLSLPVWHDKINAGIREAAASTAATARMRDAELDELFSMLRRLLARADASLQQLDLYRGRIIPRTEQTLQLATADYRGERTDFYSLVELYQELLTYQLQVARIEASLAGTLAELDRAVGCPVEFGPPRP